MAIPDFQSIMLPLLRLIEDGKEYTNSELLEKLEKYFSLTEQEKNTLLASGRQKIFVNRVAWAKSHLKQARLLESSTRGVYKITERGKKLLGMGPEKITAKYLMNYPEYKEFRTGKSDVDKHVMELNGEEEKTPQEYIDFGYAKMVQQLSSELMETIGKSSSFFFEKLVMDLVLAMGYGGSQNEAGALTGKSSDEGVDGIVNEDKLGLEVIYLQAKRWDGVVGRPELQKFAGALLGKKARKGIFITTSTFTKEAQEFSKSIDAKIVLIDGKRLTELMIEHNVGVSVLQRYEIKRLDSDYFSEDE
jgi:restriction system protein